MAQRIKINERQLRGLPKFIQQQALKAVKEAIYKNGVQLWREARKGAKLIKWNGQYRDGFYLKRHKQKELVLTMYNTAPYSGIIEVGSGPRTIGQAEFLNIIRWAKTKLNLPERQARAVAISVVRKVKDGPTEGKYIVKLAIKDITPALPKQWKAELHRQLGRTNPQQ